MRFNAPPAAQTDFARPVSDVMHDGKNHANSIDGVVNTPAPFQLSEPTTRSFASSTRSRNSPEVAERLATAIANRDPAELSRVIDLPGIDLTAPDPRTGHSPLIQLIRLAGRNPSAADLACIRLMAFATNGGTGIVNKQGVQAIQVAIIRENAPVVQILIDAGAEVSRSAWMSSIGMKHIMNRLEPGIDRYIAAHHHELARDRPEQVSAAQLRKEMFSLEPGDSPNVPDIWGQAGGAAGIEVK